MSNDLISRNEVIKAIDELGYVNCHDGKDFEANSRVDKIRQRIVEMPTAYDVDKVVESIEEKILNTSDTKTGISARMAFGKSIEIVKSGGIIR